MKKIKFDEIKTPRELLTFMGQNITYGFVGKNGKKYLDEHSLDWANNWYNECIVQSGEEVLKTKVGTCWDQVELKRLWFKKHNYQFKTIFIWFEVNKSNDLPTHTFLVYEEKGKKYWLEKATSEDIGIYEFDTYEEVIEDAKQTILKDAIKSGKAKEKDYQFLKAYEYDEVIQNLSVDDYIDHVTGCSS